MPFFPSTTEYSSIQYYFYDIQMTALQRLKSYTTFQLKCYTKFHRHQYFVHLSKSFRHDMTNEIVLYGTHFFN